MNLQELQINKKTVVVKRALREHYNLDMDFEGMNLKQSQKMLTKVRGLLSDARGTSKIYESQKNPAYLKLIMIEQALVDHINDLKSDPVQIVVENEEVQKSQVILAAQEMIDTLQKMLEQISKMNVEELNAVVEGMKNEFGTEKGEQFNASVSQSLVALQENLRTTKQSLETSLGMVTGESTAVDGSLGSGMTSVPDTEMVDAEVSATEELPATGSDEQIPEPTAEPEADLASAGRERR